MIRMLASIGVALVVLWGVLIGTASVVGQARGGDLLAYAVFHNFNNDSTSELYFMDVSARLSALVARTEGYITNMQLNHDGQLAWISCTFNECDLTLWDGTATHQLMTFSSNESAYDIAWIASEQLGMWLCSVYGCRIQVWDGITVFDLADTPIYRGIGEPIWDVDGDVTFGLCMLGSCDIMLWDGETLRNLTNTPDSWETDLRLSNNGWLTFSSWRNDTPTAMVWDGQTIEAIVLNDSTHEESALVWSTSGEWAFESCDYLQCDVVVWDGMTAQNLTDSPTLNEIYPTWSPAGQLLFLSCDVNRVCDLMLWDGSQTHNLTQSPNIHDSQPMWSSDGQFVFVTCANVIPCDLMLWDGTGIVQLTQTPFVNEYRPVWIP